MLRACREIQNIEGVFLLVELIAYNVVRFTLCDNRLTFDVLLGTLLGIKNDNPAAASVNDLIYSFLLQSGFPRASVVLDHDLLGTTVRLPANVHRPAFIIVDPATAELLAVIEAVDAIDGDTLRQVSIETGAYASRLGGRTIQGFVIRVDVRGRTEDEQIQFFRIWPNSTLQHLSSKSFPDLETLRVARKLVLANTNAPDKPKSVIVDGGEGAKAMVEERNADLGLYVPPLVLLALIVADSMSIAYRGAPLLTVSQSILAIGAALLFTVSGAIRHLKR